MKLLVIGAQGQLGWELTRTLQPLGQVRALDRQGADLAYPDQLRLRIAEFAPDVIVNAAADTQVDAAEQNPDRAMRINADTVGVLGELAAGGKALLVHYSTDYVFDGGKKAPYAEDDQPAPLNIYGRSKLAGERALAQTGCDWLVFRTSWVYSGRGKNFLKTVLRLAGERDALRVVADQYGAPTPARLIAEISAHAIRQALDERRRSVFQSDLFHLTAGGQTTWHGFADAIVSGARARLPVGSIKAAVVEPIGTADYPVSATRPNYSVLDNTKLLEHFGVHRPDWRRALELVLDDTLGAAAISGGEKSTSAAP